MLILKREFLFAVDVKIPPFVLLFAMYRGFCGFHLVIGLSLAMFMFSVGI